jgi:hypothetical protein
VSDADVETEAAAGLEPAGCLDLYECLPHAEWAGIEQDEAGATIHVIVGGQRLRFWAPKVCLPKGLATGEQVSVLATPQGLDVRRTARGSPRGRQ